MRLVISDKLELIFSIWHGIGRKVLDLWWNSVLAGTWGLGRFFSSSLTCSKTILRTFNGLFTADFVLARSWDSRTFCYTCVSWGSSGHSIRWWLLPYLHVIVLILARARLCYLWGILELDAHSKPRLLVLGRKCIRAWSREIDNIFGWLRDTAFLTKCKSWCFQIR